MSLRTALIGFGTGGAVFHAPLIATTAGLELSAVVTRDPAKRQAVRDRYPDTRLLDDTGQIWSEPDAYDLVVVAAPNRQHVPLAREALLAGLPVVLDKPVAATAAEARELGRLAGQRDLALIPFHNRRWDGDFRTVQRLLAAGALGTVTRFESRFERWRPAIKPGWKESADPLDAGSILYDLGSHLIDQALTLFGRPERVYAELDVRRPGALVPDDAFMALAHPGGVRSQLWTSAVAAQHGPRFRVLGDRAAYVTHGLDGQEEALRNGATPGDEGWGVNPPGRFGVPGAEEAVPTEPGAYQDFYSGLVTALAGKTPPVAFDDAVLGLEVIEAANRSAASGATVSLTNS